jgi:hypothetical protein
MSSAGYTVNLNRETFELLKQVQQELDKSMGFEPTLGQVVRHLLMTYYKEA